MDALRVVEADPGRQLALDEVAHEIAASRRSLQRAFEAEGITFRQAVTVARIRRAKMLLAQGDIAVHAVCARVGYRSKAEFAKAFKRHVGVRPSEYKRAMRDKRRHEAELRAATPSPSPVLAARVAPAPQYAARAWASGAICP